MLHAPGPTAATIPRAAPAARAPQGAFSLKRLALLGQPFLVPVVLLLAWEAAVRLGFLAPGLLSSPSTIAEGFWTWAFGPQSAGMNAYSGTWLESAVNSTERVFFGFAIAVVLGVPTGLFIGHYRGFERTFDPLIQALRPIPVTAWVPIAITVFGVSGGGAISLIALGAFYPVVVNSATGARDTSRQLLRAARMMGASRRQILLKVVFPSALPSIFVGLRLGLGIAWTAVIIAEMVAVKSGLGYVLWDAYYIGRMEIVLADMASIGLLGYASDRILIAVEARVLGWKRPSTS